MLGTWHITFKVADRKKMRRKTVGGYLLSNIEMGVETGQLKEASAVIAAEIKRLESSSRKNI